MANRDIFVLRESFAEFDDAYQTLIVPYLDFFGFPYREVRAEELSADCALILTGADALGAERVRAAVQAGAGLVCFADARRGAASEITFEKEQYITALHQPGEVRALYAPILSGGNAPLAGGEVLLRAGKYPLLEIARLGKGKVAFWHSYGWMSHRKLGPLHGMDDVLWRSIVWAARKPFVMQGMPPMLGMRVDDVWGAWSELSPENPLLWVEIAQSYGLKPWLGVFVDNIDARSAEKVRDYVKAGQASAFPHAFSGCEWVDTELPEHWAYLNHTDGPYSDEEMRENARRAKAWFDAHDIPISKYALGHYYEVGKNALPYLREWGCEFIGMHMKPDTPYQSGADWLMAGPYRKYERDVLSAPRPVYYGDYVFDRAFFNCVTEIRDVCDYEWAPSSQVEYTIQNGIAQVRRALDSMCPAVLFTHESCWIQRMTPKTWKRSLDGIFEAIAEYQPELLTMDEICGYARAKHDATICAAEVKENKLQLQLVGQNDRETRCYVFTEDENGKISAKLAAIPQLSGAQTVALAF